jgi:hypothetical protein
MESSQPSLPSRQGVIEETGGPTSRPLLQLFRLSQEGLLGLTLHLIAEFSQGGTLGFWEFLDFL